MERSEGRSLFRAMMVVSVAGITALVALLISGFFSGSNAAGIVLGRVDPPQASQGALQVTYPIELPAGYDSTTGIAADPSGDGVWLFSQGTIQGSPVETLFYWSSLTQTLAAFQVDSSNPSYVAGSVTPIWASADGVAWLGLGKTVFRADLSSMSMTPIQLPPVQVSSVSTSNLTPDPGGGFESSTNISSLAGLPDGSVVVGRAFAAQLQVVSPSLAISTIQLPGNTELFGANSGNLAALAGSGTVLAVLYDSEGSHTLQSYGASSGWNALTTACPSLGVTVAGAQAAVVGEGCIQTLNFNSAGTPTSVLDQGTTNVPLVSPFGSDGSLLVSDGNGVRVLSPAGNSSSVNLGTTLVDSSVGALPSNTDEHIVNIALQATGSVGSQTVWFIPEPTDGTQIGAIASAG